MLGWYVTGGRTVGKNAAVLTPSSAHDGPALSDDLSKSLLDQMHVRPRSSGAGATETQAVPTNQELDTAYAFVDKLQRQIDGLKSEAAAAAKTGDKETAAQKVELIKGEVSVLGQRLVSLQGDL